GQYEFVSGEELCVMTEAPCFAADMTIDDDVIRAFYGKVWKFEEHMLVDYLEQLAWRGRVVFTLGAEFGEEPYKVPPLWARVHRAFRLPLRALPRLAAPPSQQQLR